MSGSTREVVRAREIFENGTEYRFEILNGGYNPGQPFSARYYEREFGLLEWKEVQPLGVTQIRP